MKNVNLSWVSISKRNKNLPKLRFMGQFLLVQVRSKKTSRIFLVKKFNPQAKSPQKTKKPPSPVELRCCKSVQKIINFKNCRHLTYFGMSLSKSKTDLSWRSAQRRDSRTFPDWSHEIYVWSLTRFYCGWLFSIKDHC